MRILAFARGAGLAIVFALMVFAGMAAGTDECAAVDTTNITIDCGTGHETYATRLSSAMNNVSHAIDYKGKYYEFTLQATSSGSTVTVTCPNVSNYENSPIPTGVVRTAVMRSLMKLAGYQDTSYVSGFTMDNEELLWHSQIGFLPSYMYKVEENDYDQAYAEYQQNINYSLDRNISSYDGVFTFYLLWQKPYTRPVNVSFNTPLCGSMEAPSATCETLPFVTHPNTTSNPIEEPVWFAEKPEGNAMTYRNWSRYYTYNDALKGGIPYYACAVFRAPWGYYFPDGFSNVTVNGQPAEDGDVWVEDYLDSYEHLYVGAFMTPEHVWSDNWTVTTEPTCSAEGVESRPCTQGCGTFDTRPIDIDSNAHSWGAWTTVKKATALNAGQQQRVCAHDASHIQKRTLPATGVKGLLLAQMKSSGKTKLYLTWTKVTGAEGYDIFFAKCNSNETKSKYKYAKSIKGNKTFSWTKSGLKKNTSYKAYVKAWAYKNGKKTYVRTSPGVHAFTSGGSKKYTNPKSVTVAKASVTLKKSGTFKIKGKVNKLSAKKKLPDKGHGAALRYYTSNKAIATVSSAGKITAKAKGKCTVYVLSISGVRKAVAVTVK